MLSREENELLTRVGPGTPMGDPPPLLAARRCSPRSCPRPTARPCACGCWARTWSPSATRTAGSACSTPTARTAAPRCSSAATRNAACAASTTAGSSTSTGALRRHAQRAGGEQLQGQGPADAPTLRGARRRRLGLHGPARASAAAARPGVDARAGRATATSPRPRGVQLAAGARGRRRHLALSFLHHDRSRLRPQATLAYRGRAGAPRLEVLTTDYGFTYASIRHLREEQQHYVRVYQFVMPFYQLRAFEGYHGRPLAQGHLWVPVDDEHTFVYNWICAADDAPLPRELVDEVETKAGRGPPTSCRAIARSATRATSTCSTASYSAPATPSACAASTPRTSPCRRAWAPSSIAARSTSAPATWRSSPPAACC